MSHLCNDFGCDGVPTFFIKLHPMVVFAEETIALVPVLVQIASMREVVASITVAAVVATATTTIAIVIVDIAATTAINVITATTATTNTTGTTTTTAATVATTTASATTTTATVVPAEQGVIEQREDGRVMRLKPTTQTRPNE